MEATLCLRAPPQASAKKPHCLLTPNGRIPNLLRHCLVLHGASTFSSCALRAAGPSCRCRLLMRADVPPPPKDSGSSKASGWSRPAGVGAAVVLACFLGVACSSLKRGGFAHAVPFGWPPIGRPTPPTTASSFPSPMEGPFERTFIQKSLDSLSEIVERKAGTGAQKLPTLSELLTDQLRESKIKKDPSLLELSADGGKAADSLYKEWVNKKGYEVFDLGLLLIDVFINQGYYTKANDICNMIPKKMEKENIPMPPDIRYQLRKDIINAMLALDIVLSGVKEETKEIKDLKNKTYEMMLELINSGKKSGQLPDIS